MEKGCNVPINFKVEKELINFNGGKNKQETILSIIQHIKKQHATYNALHDSTMKYQHLHNVLYKISSIFESTYSFNILEIEEITQLFNQTLVYLNAPIDLRDSEQSKLIALIDILNKKIKVAS